VLPARRLEDYIRSLAQKLIETDDVEEIRITAAELQAAISKHNARSHDRLTARPVPNERRIDE